MHPCHLRDIRRLLGSLLALASFSMMNESAARTQPPTTAPVVSPEQVRVLEGHKGSVEALDFTSDEKTLVSCSRDHTIKFWNWQTGELLRTLDAHDSDVIDVQFSPHGDLIASCGRDKTIK